VTIRIFFDHDFTHYVLFTADALVHMYAHAQRGLWQKEAGGELFANDPDASGLVITAASGPNPRDRRSRNSWKPDTAAADRDRQQQFIQGRHAVGLWHTHPESFPSPSGRDRQTTHDYLEAFHGERKRYLMVTLGNSGNSPNMALWVASYEKRSTWTELIETPASSIFVTTRLERRPGDVRESG
jgi:integrative and conjugative element protein (TIGR02256 family)